VRSLVSIIIPVFNRKDFILECLESIIDQSYRPLEVIIVDDGSTDKSLDVISDFIENRIENDLDIKLIKQINSGAPKARNAGLKLANGEFVQFLDSDDLLLPDKLNNQVSAFKRLTDIVYSKAQFFINSRSNLKDKYWGRKLTGEDIDYFEFPWQTMCALYRRCYLIDNQMYWDENLKIHQDWDFSIRHVIATDRIIFLDEVNSLYRSHDTDRIGLNLNVDKIKSMEQTLLNAFKQLEIKGVVTKKLRYLYFKRLSFCFYKYGIDSLKPEKREVWKKMFYVTKGFSIILSPFLLLGSPFFKIFEIVYRK
jgi:glycosyltransferase involved in cell wall biosynthesis